MVEKVRTSHRIRGNYIMTDDKAPVELPGIQVIDQIIQEEEVTGFSLKKSSCAFVKSYKNQFPTLCKISKMKTIPKIALTNRKSGCIV